MPDITSAPYGCSSNSIQPIIIAFGEGLDISLSSLFIHHAQPNHVDTKIYKEV